MPIGESGSSSSNSPASSTPPESKGGTTKHTKTNDTSRNKTIGVGPGRFTAPTRMRRVWQIQRFAGGGMEANALAPERSGCRCDRPLQGGTGGGHVPEAVLRRTRQRLVDHRRQALRDVGAALVDRYGVVVQHHHQLLVQVARQVVD